MNQQKIEPSKRLIAFLIDLIVCYLLAIVLSAIISLIPVVNRIFFLSTIFSQRFILLLLFLCRDYFFGGRGIGKKFMGLQVIKVDSGLPISLMQSVLRNLTLTVPMLCLEITSLMPVNWLPAIVIQVFNIFEAVYAIIVFPLESYRAYNSDNSSRLGDKLAHTRVIESPTNLIT